MGIGVLGIGSYLPSRVVSNDEIAGHTSVSPEWIVDRTGIRERRYGEPHQSTSDLAVAASRESLRAVAGDPAVIVVATSTPDQPQPATAAVLQAKLGLSGIPAFDINAVCSGFLYALSVGDALLRTSMAGQIALVVGADKYSTIIDPTERRTASLFGDGAGAVVLGSVPDGYGIVGSRLVTDGEYAHLIEVVAGGTRRPLDDRARADGDHYFRMNGFAVREYAMQVLPDIVEPLLKENGITVADLERVVFHQANDRMIEGCAARLAIPMDKVPLSSTHFGNTASASIPITLAETAENRPLRRGDWVLLVSVGGGMTAGAVLMRWFDNEAVAEPVGE
ncbi:3-oxoacyl-ACP synthase III family protein [Mangrovihabitans endophyticus]|uniref:3-oxoacyl-[acyl-carrier-protein] synthase 3 n=1 Tax=Mangrovihabitans endophyticus TaxID=1751298 RepID=A0A8J3BZ77_9ACTN|nr:beta-ketoacyl-ACP synthase III [Mangrovihabitans endophyticus]GGK85071.1 3-oxoacyl-[acyl-carrier-protein] synthase 3 [Mangrovihabitans endophyticus]